MTDYMSTLNALKKEQHDKRIYCTLFHEGPYASINTRLIIDNESREANEVVWTAMAIIDLMLEQMEHDEPSMTTDLFTLVADGERMQLDPAVLVLDGEESELTRWQAFREQFLSGAHLEFGHQFINEPDEHYTPGFGIPKLFADLLEGGKFAQWVTMTVNLDNGDYGTWKTFRNPCPQRQWRFRQRRGEEFLGQSYWMNGMRDGQYVCGEIPFVRNDVAMMSAGSWYQSTGPDWTDCDDQRGIILTLMPNIPDALLERLVALGHKFNEKLRCDVEMNLTPNETIELKGNREPLSLDERVELYRSWYGMDSATEQQLVERAERDDEAERRDEAERSQGSRPVQPRSWDDDNELMVRIYLERFAEMREYFTDEEVEAFLASNPRVQELLTRHAAEKYTEDEIRLYRFGVSLLTMLQVAQQYEEKKQSREQRLSYGTSRPEDEAPLLPLSACGWPEHLIEKARSLPEALKESPAIIRKGWMGEYRESVELEGMNDMSHNDAFHLWELFEYGLKLQITNISLNSHEDVLTLEALLNEMAELEEAAHTTDPVVEEGQELKTCLVTLLNNLWESTLDRDDPRRSMLTDENTALYEPVYYDNLLTNREMYAYLRSTGDCNMEGSAIRNEPFDFEATDDGVFARLRFRRENGRFIHEVSLLDGEEG